MLKHRLKMVKIILMVLLGFSMVEYVRYLDRDTITDDDVKMNTSFYAAVAPGYASSRAWTEDTRSEIAEQLISFAAPYVSKGDTIGVLGTGTGSDQDLLIRTFPECKIFGVDISPEMLYEAKDRINDHVAVAEACQLPFPNNSLNFVYAESAPQHWDEKYIRAVLNEVRRVAIVDGRPFNMLFSVRMGTGNIVEILEDLRTMFLDDVRALKTWQQAMMEIGSNILQTEENTTPQYFIKKRFSTFREEQIREIMKTAGYTIKKNKYGVGGTPSVKNKLKYLDMILELN